MPTMVSNLKSLKAISFALLFFFSSTAWTQNLVDDEFGRYNFRVFLNSTIYGVCAGAIVGAATMTDFTTDFEKADLKDIARGASYGLYGGILLGFTLILLTGRSSSPETEEEVYDEVRIFPEFSTDSERSMALNFNFTF